MHKVLFITSLSTTNYIPLNVCFVYFVDYYVKEISAGRNIEKDELEAVKLWLDNIAKNKDKMREDDSDLRTNESNEEYIEAEASPKV